MIRQSIAASKKNRAHQGQIIIFVGLLAVSMLGMVGLAVDLGYTFAQKRSVQNAADAGALAGTHAVTQWSTTDNGVSALSDVTKIIKANNMGDATQTISCIYVNDQNKSQGSCSATVPENATGVTVSVSETHDTFFMRLIPGGPKTVTTRASATAHAEIVTPDGSGGPFIVCGSNANLVSGGSEAILLQNGSGGYSLNPDAIGDTFEVHGKIDDCGAPSNSYKGVADENNYGLQVPGWFTGITGERTGPVRERVRGIGGCTSMTPYPIDCIMYLPLSYDDGSHPAVKSGKNFSFYVVAYGVFKVSQCSGSCKHEATLIGSYSIEVPSGMGAWQPGTWKRGDKGILTARLTK